MGLESGSRSGLAAHHERVAVAFQAHLVEDHTGETVVDAMAIPVEAARQLPPRLLIHGGHAFWILELYLAADVPEGLRTKGLDLHLPLNHESCT